MVDAIAENCQGSAESIIIPLLLSYLSQH